MNAPDTGSTKSVRERNPLNKLKRLGFGAASAVIIGVGVAVAGWFTHLIVAIQVLTSSGDLATTVGYAVLLVLGVVIPPIGALHGIGIWFGVF
jgi:hypothetical protein